VRAHSCANAMGSATLRMLKGLSLQMAVAALALADASGTAAAAGLMTLGGIAPERITSLGFWLGFAFALGRLLATWRVRPKPFRMLMLVFF